MKLNNAHELLVDSLKDLYSAEGQLIVALPKMAKGATNAKLKKGFEDHLEQTKVHAKRIEEIAEVLDFNPGGLVCKAMKGLIEEGAEILESEGNENVLDAGLIVAAQKVENYEKAGYSSVIAMAKGMNHMNAVDLLTQTLTEEEDTYEKLEKVAEDEVTPAALDTVDMAEMAKMEDEK